MQHEPMPTPTIDNHAIDCRAETRVLDAARAANVYISTLCSHPDLPIGRGAKSVSAVYRGATRVESAALGEFDGCGLCLIEVDGEIAHACDTRARRYDRQDEFRCGQARAAAEPQPDSRDASARVPHLSQPRGLRLDSMLDECAGAGTLLREIRVLRTAQGFRLHRHSARHAALCLSEPADRARRAALCARLQSLHRLHALRARLRRCARRWRAGFCAREWTSDGRHVRADARRIRVQILYCVRRSVSHRRAAGCGVT